MKICFVTSWFPTSRNPGLAPFVYNLARDLVKAGIAVHVFALDGNDDIMTKDGIQIFPVKRMLSFVSILKKIRELRPDIIHVQAPAYFSSMGIPLAKLCKLPVIATIHRAEVEPASPIWSIVRKQALSRFDKIVCVSESTKLKAVRAGGKETEMAVIYNSCDEAVFHPRDKIESRRKLKLPLDIKIILFVGNLIPRKDVSTLIRGLSILQSKFDNFLALVVGGGPERNSLVTFTLTANLSGKVTFTGRVPNEKLALFYSSADIFVIPSLSEGHAVAVLEAMASGLPVIATDIPANRESIEEGKNGYLFHPQNERELAEKIYMMITMDELTTQMSFNSLSLYKEKFSTALQIQKYMSIYNDLLKVRGTKTK